MSMEKKASIKKAERDPRHLRFKAISTALTIAVIVGIIVLNIIVSVVADRYPITIDLSSEKVFTLSEDSKKFAQSIENEVEVIILADPEEYFIAYAEQLYMYAQIDFSRPFERISREVSTALAQLKSSSNGKITYTIINPDQEPEKYAKYTEYNLGEEYNVLFISGERYKKDNLANMVEPIDQNTVNSKVEDVLVSKIYALQGESDRIIQVLTGHNENAATIAGIQRLYELNGYTVEELAITGSTNFNENAEVLLIAAPTNDYTKEEIRRIESWLENDKKRNHHLMVFIDPEAPVSQLPNLYGLLKDSYHIEVTDQVIYESDENRYFHDGKAINQSYVWADIPTNKYTSTSYGGAVKTPVARRLLCDLPDSPTSNGIEKWGLQLTTHPESAVVNTIGSDEEKKALKDDEYPLISGVSYVYEATDNNEFTAATTTVTVFGSAAMAYGTYIQDYSASNEELLLDVIHAITGYKTDITISSKELINDVTQFKTGTQLALGIWVFTVGLPATVLVICLVIFLRRRRL